MINSPRCCKKKKRNPFLFAVQGFALNRDDSGATVPQPPEQSAFPWESKCEMIAGFCDCRQTCYWSLPLRFCWPSREREEKTLQDFPYAHTHTHTHTYTQSPFTTVLQFPELLNNVIISLPCPVLLLHHGYLSQLLTQGHPSLLSAELNHLVQKLPRSLQLQPAPL